MTPTHGLTRIERMRRSAEFLAVFRRGRCFRGAVMRIHFLPNDLGRSRVGLVVSRKVGGAVVRSRVKRRLRHVFRESKRSLPVGLDVVLVASPEHGEAGFAEYRAVMAAFVDWLAARSVAARPADPGDGARRKP